MGGFLNKREIARMQADYNLLLASPEASSVTIQITTATGAYDPAFRIRETTDTNAYSSIENVRCIQQMVKPKDRDILNWGIMEVGDCIFYFRNDLDLGNNQTDEDNPNTTITILDPSQDLEWVTVPGRTKDFNRYLLTRLGNSQLGQVIPARIKKTLRSFSSPPVVLP